MIEAISVLKLRNYTPRALKNNAHSSPPDIYERTVIRQPKSVASQARQPIGNIQCIFGAETSRKHDRRRRLHAKDEDCKGYQWAEIRCHMREAFVSCRYKYASYM